MPKRYDFKEQDFLKFKAEMMKEGFRQIEPYEFYTELTVADVAEPRPRVGREEGFIFSALGLEVRVWTSFIMKENGVRTLDSGWVVVRSFGVAKYFAPQMYRTKDSLKECWYGRAYALSALSLVRYARYANHSTWILCTESNISITGNAPIRYIC